MNTAPFIVIDGTDGSGKGTQTKLLVERLRSEGRAVEQLSFPRYGKPEAFFIEQYLNGHYGSLSEVGPYRASVLFAVERFHVAQEIRKMQSEGTIIVSDRYVSANKGMQMGKIDGADEQKKFLDWLNDFEYGILGIPKPDLTLLLHVPSDVAYELVAQKDERGYLNGKKRDIHEANLPFLQKAEQAYLSLPKMDTVENWEVFSCMENGQLLPIQTIHERLWQRIFPLLP